MRTIAIGLLFGAVLVAEWASGRLPLGGAAAGNLFAELFVERMHPWAAQALVAFMLLLATIIAVLPRSVMLVPARGLFGVLFAFWVWLGLSLTQTQHFHLSLLELARWTVYLVAVQVVLATIGRVRLPSVALGVVVTGAALVALSGIQEYLSPGTPEGWRVFAGWHNPNAAASLFALVLPPALALALVVRESSGKALALLGVAVISAALFLTASKGGLLSAAVGVVGFVLVSAVVGHRVRWVPLGAAFAVSAAVSLGVVGLKSLAAPERGSATRLLAAREEAEQSFAFRRQVWTDTSDMIAERPLLGFGVGAYAPEFKRFSQVQAPVLAHNSYLQLAAEAGVPAVLLFLGFGILYLLHVSRRHPGEASGRALLRSGCAGAAFAAGANALVDSTFSIFGYGFVFFVIVAVGLVLSADGAQPEKAPLNSRAIGHTLPAAGAAAYLVIGFLSAHLVATARAQQSSDAATKLIALAARLAPADPGPMEARAQWLAERSPVVAAACWQHAARLSPTPSRWAEAAKLHHRTNNVDEALAAARAAIQAEPSNPRWRAIELQILRDTGRMEEAAEVAENMVRMENTLFFALRSLPWLVELSTVEARIFLADRARERGDLQAEAEQLEGAYRLLRAYRLSTLPELLRQTGMDEVIAKRIELEQANGHEPLLGDVAEALGLGPSELLAYTEAVARLPLAGESLVKARSNVEQLELIGGRLADVYESLDRAEVARKIRQEVNELSWQRLRLGFAGL
jgi:O-antigen ligase/tetratricopeptide (TPR) repeat protein